MLVRKQIFRKLYTYNCHKTEWHITHSVIHIIGMLAIYNICWACKFKYIIVLMISYLYRYIGTTIYRNSRSMLQTTNVQYWNQYSCIKLSTHICKLHYIIKYKCKPWCYEDKKHVIFCYILLASHLLCNVYSSDNCSRLSSNRINKLMGFYVMPHALLTHVPYRAAFTCWDTKVGHAQTAAPHSLVAHSSC